MGCVSGAVTIVSGVKGGVKGTVVLKEGVENSVLVLEDLLPYLPTMGVPLQPDFAPRVGRSNRYKPMNFWEKWWAHRDLNACRSDWEAAVA